MEKVIVTQGTKQNLSSVFTDLQDYANTNLKRRFDQIIDTYGIEVEVVNSVVTGTSFAVSQSATTTLAIEAGSGITDSFGFVRTTSQTSVSLGAIASGDYTLVVNSVPVTDTPTTVVNGFLYEEGGATTTNTRGHASTVFSLEDDPYTVTTSGLYLADISWNGVDTAVITDRRDENVLTIKSSTLDDATFVKKDRDSTISANMTAKLPAGTGTFKVTDSNDTVVLLVEEDGITHNVPVTYNDLVTLTTLNVTDGVTLPGYITLSGITNPEFIVGYGTLNGGAGLRVLTEDPDPTNITNFKVYDNKPTSNPSEKNSYVHLTWNYKDVNGIYISSNIFEVTGLIEAGGNIDNTSDNIVDKYLYFPESGNRYQILTWDNSTKRMTLGDNYDDNMEEPNIPNFPARIIDGAGTGYQVKVTSNKDNSAEIDFKESDTKILNLDSTFITNPELSLKLALGESHWIQIRCVNNLTSGSFIVLPSGIYDPDHAPGGQGTQSYSTPFVNTLPTLDDDGSITLDATLFGFNIDVGGWYDETDIDKSAHEFEVGYTTLSSLDWSSTTNTTKFKTANRHIPVSTNTSATWNVGVRAIQNKQVVSLTKTAQVLAGGGGVPPNMSLMAEAIANVTVISGLYANSTQIEIEPALLPAYQFNDITYYGGITLGTNQLAQPGQPKKLIPDGETWNSGDGSGIIYANNSTDATADKYIQSLGEGPNAGLTNQLFYIGVSEASRKIYQTSLNSNMRVKKIVFDCDIANGVSAVNPGVIRVYQSGDEANAGTLDITGVNAVFTQDLDVEILASTDASRTLIIDAWDPDTGSPNNTCQLSGTIRLYGENIVATRTDASTTQSGFDTES